VSLSWLIWNPEASDLNQASMFLASPVRGRGVPGAILLEQGLEVLSDLQRKVMYLYFYENLSHTEIGRRFSLPQRKVSRIIASATRNFKKWMSERDR
jgi:hypothetical protein